MNGLDGRLVQWLCCRWVLLLCDIVYFVVAVVVFTERYPTCVDSSQECREQDSHRALLCKCHTVWNILCYLLRSRLLVVF